MWSRFDFEEIEDLHAEAAETYDISHPNHSLAQTLLVTTHNLHDFWLIMKEIMGELTRKDIELQLIYLRRGIPTLFSVYHLTKHHYYSAAYSRVRFLWELYIVVRELNRDKEKTERKWKSLESDIKQGNFGPYDTLPTTEYFSGRRRQIQGDLEKKEEKYGKMYDRLSNFGSHPNSFKSSANDGSWNEEQELDVLRFGLIFVYALSAQYIRTFEDTELESSVRKKLDDIFVQILCVYGYLPTFLEEDLEFGAVGT